MKEEAVIYTMERWRADRIFNAVPGQEVTAEVYNDMLNSLPPKELPASKAGQALRDYKIPVHTGFLMGEPNSSDRQGMLYHAFGMNDYGKGKRYFYLGLSHAAPILNGSYYFMDCLNAFINDGLFPEKEFSGDADAIQTAANYEATLYKYEYRDGVRISSKVLYQPGLM